MNFGKKKIKIFILILVITIFTISLQTSKPIYNNVLLQELKKENNRFIAHASGGIDSHKYTNSNEGISNSIKNGFKFIEIDLLETKDQIFVGVHDWKSFKEKTNYMNKNLKLSDPILYNEFKKLKIYNKYHPLDIDEINNIFLKNKNLYLVIDKTKNFKKIKNDLKFDQDRILVEIIGKDNFFQALKDEIKNPIYNYDPGDYKFILKNKIKIITTSMRNILENQDEFQELINKEIFVFAYSSNNEEFIKNNIGKLFTQVYTDFWDINKLKCTIKKDLCSTY